MGSSNDLEADEVVGCAGAVWSLVVTLSMWMILLFTILVEIEAPAYAWILFWMYLPAQIIGGVLAHTARVMAMKRKMAQP